MSAAIFKTFTGVDFDLLDPSPNMIDIRDIAHSLSNECRFGGHCTWHYSVAQHSVIVSEIAQPWDALRGLLHDAAETYLKDLPPQLKLMFPGYVEMEARVMAAVHSRFGIEPDAAADERITKIDHGCLIAAECRDVYPHIVLKQYAMKAAVAPHKIPYQAEVEYGRQFLKLANLPNQEHSKLRVHFESILANYLRRDATA